MSMYPRTNYEMTQSDLDELLDSMRPVPLIALNIGGGMDRQERANSAWARLGKKMGFDHMTVQPNGRGDRFFSAVPSETEDQRVARLEKEQEDKRLAEIDQLQKEIAERQTKLTSLIGA